MKKWWLRRREEEIEQGVSQDDLEIETFTDSTPYVRMRITHRPTGTVVRGKSLSRTLLREGLLADLSEKLKGRKFLVCPRSCMRMSYYENDGEQRYKFCPYCGSELHEW